MTMKIAKRRKSSEQLQRESELRRREMLHAPVPQLVTKLALPTVAVQLITVVYNTADTYFVAKIHTSAAAAVGVVFALMSIIQAFGFGIGMGAASLISRKLGAGRDDEAHQIASSALAAAFAFGALLMIGGELTLSPLLRLLGATETILGYARSYTAYILLGAPLMCGTFVLNNVLRAEGETQFAMWGLCSGGILNVFLDPLLIFGMDLGIAGAAIATIVSQAVSFLVLGSFFRRGKSIVQLQFRLVSRKPGTYWQIVSTGIPTICRQSLGSISAACLNVLAAGYGDAAVAAMTIATKVSMLIRHVMIGIGQGMQPAAGYNYGAGVKRRVRQVFWFASACGTVIGWAAGIALFRFAPAVIAWFCPEPEVVAVGALALRCSCVVMPVLAYATYVNQLSQVLGFRLGATLLACCRQGIFFLPAAILLPLGWGLHGVAAIQPSADLLTFVVSAVYQIRFFRRNLTA